jgi:hypothetical protein
VGDHWSPRQRKPPAHRDEGAQRVLKARKPLPAPGVDHPVQWDGAMTASTKRHAAGEHQQGKTHRSPSALQRRRQEARERSRAGDPSAVICREMGGSKSWLSTWQKRHQCTEPDGVQEHARRPQSMPTKTPDRLAADLIRLHQTLSPDGLGPVSPNVMRDDRRQHGAARVPSRRTISRILSRQAKESNANSVRSYVSGCLSHRSRGTLCTSSACLWTCPRRKALKTRALGIKGRRKMALGEGGLRPKIKE